MDEEIPSDPELEADEEVAPPLLAQSGRRKRRIKDYPDLLAKRHKAFEKYRSAAELIG